MQDGFVRHILIILAVLFVLSLIGYDFIDILKTSGVGDQAQGFWSYILKFFEIFFEPARAGLIKLIEAVEAIL